MSLIFREVIGGFLVSAGLLFFRCKGQWSKVFGCAVFVDFIEAGLAPVVAEKARRRSGRCRCSCGGTHHDLRGRTRGFRGGTACDFCGRRGCRNCRGTCHNVRGRLRRNCSRGFRSGRRRTRNLSGRTVCRFCGRTTRDFRRRRCWNRHGRTCRRLRRRGTCNFRGGRSRG